MMRTLTSMFIVAAAVVGLCSITPAASARKVLPMPIVGGYKPIENVNEPHIQQLGRWVISEHDKASKDRLSFSKVVSGQEQVVAGKKYMLVIQATKGGAGKSATYGAVVWEKVDKTRQLLSFNPAR